jgi:signal transduction histidine kinase/DNA-binding response OmpR family regulator
MEHSEIRNPKSEIIRVLLIEDDPGYARLIREILKEAGAGQFELARAERLDDGLRCLGEEAFDVMLLDLNLLDSQGLDTFLRAYVQAPEVPIVVLTGLADEVLGVKAIQGGAQDYLVKGQVDSNLLVRSMRYAIERKQVEEVLRQRNRELAMLNRLGQELTATFDLPQLTERLLQTVMETIGVEAVSVWLWDEERESWLVCQAAFPPDQNRSLVNLHLPPGQGIAGWVAREEESVIVANVQDDPRFFPGIDEQTGFHTASLLAVPLRARGKMIGVLEVVNKRDGAFDEDNRALVEMLAASAAIAIENARLYVQAQQEIAERKHAEEALHYRLAFDQLITSISTLFVQLTPDDVGSGIDFALQAIAKFAAVDRSYIFLFSDDGTKMDNTHEWCAEGIPSQIESRRELPVQRFPWWRERLNRLEAVHIPRVADLPPEARAEKEFLESQAVQSLVAVPMVYSTSLVGFVGFDWVRVEKTWAEGIITLLKIVGEIFVNALERKRAQEQRERLIEELDAFAHTVAHDLKSPLCTIVSFADMLEEDYATIPDGERQECLQMIVRGGHKAVSIIDELLLLAGVRKLEEVEMGPLDMASIVAEAQQHLAQMIEEHQAEIVLPDTWPVATGYSPWVEEVWVNYLSNAIKYGGQPPRVELGASPPSVPPACGGEAKGRRMARFWVRDNGPGLTPEEQARLFIPFTRLDQVRAKGHGLGLSIVWRIVEKLGGQVGVESEVGRGSVFTFTLPATANGH